MDGRDAQEKLVAIAGMIRGGLLYQVRMYRYNVMIMSLKYYRQN